MEGLVILYLLVILVFSCIWGHVTKSVMLNKGYPEYMASNWFWWGFFFGWIPLVIAATKPEYQPYRPAERTAHQTQPEASPQTGNQLVHRIDVQNEARVAIPSPTPGLIFCPYCGHEQRSDRNRCYVCSNLFSKPKAIDSDSTNQAAKRDDAKSTEQDSIQLLREYKALLDSGVITQEEFEAKKTQLLT